jgi:hypothetical protein
MKKLFYQFLLSLLVTSYSCSNKEKEAHIMRMSGYVENVPNPKDIRCNKGDTIILMIHCNQLERKPCEPSIYGIYTGEIEKTNVVWEKGEIKASYSYEKAVFLRNAND